MIDIDDVVKVIRDPHSGLDEVLASLTQARINREVFGSLCEWDSVTARVIDDIIAEVLRGQRTHADARNILFDLCS